MSQLRLRPLGARVSTGEQNFRPWYLPPAKLCSVKATEVFDTYWRFAAERQDIFFRRLSNAESPWTDDTVLRTYKFTNVYRASDRVTQYLIREVIYEADQSVNEVFFRILLFKLFNKIETWHLLTRELGTVSCKTYSYKHYDKVLSRALSRGARIYSAAYIMPSGTGALRCTRKHQAHLRLLELMMKNDLPSRIADARNMSEAFTLLRSYPMIGDFLAYQYITDINYSQITAFSENEFVVPGPGARSGIRKCFKSLGGLTETQIIQMMADRQVAEFARLGLTFQSLWGRPLHLIDCQNLFCEVDKYARVRHPEVVGSLFRTRIKQKFRPSGSSIEFWFPPKWGITDLADKKQREMAKVIGR